jgi:hypothetical protein
MNFHLIRPHAFEVYALTIFSDIDEPYSRYPLPRRIAENLP